MLFYTGIFLASLVVLLVARFIYKAVFVSCKVVSSASEQVCKSNERFATAANASGHLTCGIGKKAVTGPLIAPGLNTHVTAWNLARKKKTNDGKEGVWPPCEAIVADGGRDSKVRRYEGGPKILTLDMVSKPFRRDVAPDTPTPVIDSKTPSLETVNKPNMQEEVPMNSGSNTESKPWGW